MNRLRLLFVDPDFRAFCRYTGWFLMILLILASIAMKNLILVQHNPFLYENF
jgi:hypothetical protein